jgi:uncharacterized LabA/DUF88 family protein
VARLAVFIDGAYVDFMLREEFEGVRIDHQRFAGELVPAGSDLLRCYYYTCPPHVSDPPTEDERIRQQSFDRFNFALGRIPRFEVRLGKLAKRFNQDGTVRYEQKRVDALLSIDVVRLASKQQIQELVLVAGDSDFVPALQAAKDEGVLVRLYHGSEPHRELLQTADECRRIDAAFVQRVLR